MDRLHECQRANPDGWGLMWPDNGRLATAKGIHPDTFEERLATVPPGVPLVIHFRTASIGQITREACHPHMVNDRLAFAHNGNLFHFSDYFYSDRRTDSQRFCDWLKIRWCPGIIQDLERYCVSNYSKMVFMNNQGQVLICNEAAGMWENGCWFSNGGIEHYVGYGYSGAYGYGKGETRHKGGLISVQGFGGEWKQCEYCKGWFKDLDRVCPNCEAYFGLVGLQ